MSKLYLGTREVCNVARHPSPVTTLESITITPTTVAQTITPINSDAFNSVTVNAVTASIDSNIKPENIVLGVNILGVDGTMATFGIPKRIVDNVLTNLPDNSYIFNLPNNVIDLESSVFKNSFSDTYYDGNDLYTMKNIITAVDLSNLETVSGDSALSSAFEGCTKLTSVDLSSLETVSGSHALSNAFSRCSNLTSVDLSSLTTVSGSHALDNACEYCSNLTSVDLSSLETISGSHGLSSAFSECDSLTSMTFSNLTTIGAYGLYQAFSFCTSLTSLYFPSLTTNSFGSYTNQFNNMLYGVTGCTVHFPSNLQSVIGSWSAVTGGFGGTNTVILYDLPTTS